MVAYWRSAGWRTGRVRHSCHNGYNPIIAYIGVLPAYRGHGYIDELLAEGTRILAAEDVPRIRASTDLGNVPMANAFRRAGWADSATKST